MFNFYAQKEIMLFKDNFANVFIDSVKKINYNSYSSLNKGLNASCVIFNIKKNNIYFLLKICVLKTKMDNYTSLFIFLC